MLSVSQERYNGAWGEKFQRICCEAKYSTGRAALPNLSGDGRSDDHLNQRSARRARALLPTQSITQKLSRRFGVFERIGRGRVLVCFDHHPAFEARVGQSVEDWREVKGAVAGNGEDAGLD